jgi:hypothetical protein
MPNPFRYFIIFVYKPCKLFLTVTWWKEIHIVFAILFYYSLFLNAFYLKAEEIILWQPQDEVGAWASFTVNTLWVHMSICKTMPWQHYVSIWYCPQSPPYVWHCH